MRPLIRVALGVLVLLGLLWARRKLGKVGTFYGIPYDLRWPSPKVVAERLWNPQDSRLFTPKLLGWGWSVNFYTVMRRLGLLR